MNETSLMNLSNGVLCFEKADGTYEKVMDVQDLREATITPDDSLEENTFAIDDCTGACVCTFRIPRAIQRWFKNYAAYGWRRKTHVRKKQLIKANMRMGKKGRMYLWQFQNIINV